MDTVIRAIETYNTIHDIEDRLSSGEEIEGLDIDLMMKTKKDAKKVLEDNLNISVI